MKRQSTNGTKQQSAQDAGWTPKYHEQTRIWLENQSTTLSDKPLHPVIKEFQDLIENNPLIRMALNKMIEQVPEWYSDFHSSEYHNTYLKDVGQMLCLINDVLDSAPEFNQTALVGCPINAILDWCMFTPAGCSVFANKEINGLLRKILQTWKAFLDSPASLYVLNSSSKGWQCEDALKQLNMADYQYDPTDKHWGFKSWNDFFSRRLKANARPIAEPDNKRVIVNACDSAVYKISRNVQKKANFWIKEQPYSVQDMLAGSWDTDYFTGGDVYQAFLCALDYHRWHSPITGIVKKLHKQPGTYYSEAESEGADPGGPDKSQGYIAHVATRAMIYIESDDPSIGVVCVMFVGMAEISSCEFNAEITVGSKVSKGQELGCFQYGGSTYCMLFKAGAIKEFHTFEQNKMKMGQEIARAN